MVQTLLTILSIVLGALIGWLIPWFDKVAYIYILHPEAQVSQYIKYQLAQRQWRAAWLSLQRRGAEFDKLTSRGVLFQLAWVVLAFFAVTSAAGWFGKVLVLALGVRILTEEWREYVGDRAVLRKKLFWQVGKEWGESELKIYLVVMTLLVVWLARLLI